MAAQGVKMTLSPEDPAAAAAQPVRRGDVFGGAAVLGAQPSDDNEQRGAILALPARASDDRQEQEEAFLGEEDEELADEALSDEEDEEVYYDGADDSGSEFDDEDETSESGDGEAEGKDELMAATEITTLQGRPAGYAAVQSTAGFMRVVAAAEAGKDSGGGEILVDYRYTRFCRARSGGHAVDVCGVGPKLHRVRYLVSTPVAGDQASTMRLAGAALANDIYPDRFSQPLHALWSAMVAAAPVRVPPRATRVKVAVDVGILRRGDRTPERMKRMRAALPVLAREDEEWPRVGMELRLPVPMRREDGEPRPAKRRRVAGEECPICYDVLERDLAAWPRCGHVFHGGCLEQLLLKGSQRCPMCRSTLSKAK
ncbi:hypothetical protein ACP70R_028604 [Stipagrostis hirtigluma subsp. patula]